MPDCQSDVIKIRFIKAKKMIILKMANAPQLILQILALIHIINPTKCPRFGAASALGLHILDLKSHDKGTIGVHLISQVEKGGNIQINISPEEYFYP